MVRINSVILIAVLAVSLLISSSSVLALVMNYPPVADANGPYTGHIDSTVTLDGSGSTDPDSDIVVYEWDLDNDGQYDDAVGVTASYSWGLSGVYTVGLRVTDEHGASSVDTATVNVNPPDFVIPEFPFGTVTALLIMASALLIRWKNKPFYRAHIDTS